MHGNNLHYRRGACIETICSGKGSHGSDRTKFAKEPVVVSLRVRLPMTLYSTQIYLITDSSSTIGGPYMREL